MTRAVFFPVLFVIGFGFPATVVQAQEKPADKHRSPRATVRTLLTAITAAQANPHLIKEAAACLDLSDLPANQKQHPGLLATELEAVLRARDVDSDLIHNDNQGTEYVFPDRQGSRIALQRMPDGRWLFDRDTVAHIPQLYAEAQKRLQEKNKEAASLNVSPEHASARATVRSFVTGYRRQDFKRILGCLDLRDLPTVAREEVGRQLANKLKQIIVRQRRIILQELPDSNYSDPYVWLSQPEGVIELVRIPSGDRKGEWVFSQATVNAIDKLYLAFEEKPYNEELVALGTSFYLPHPWIETELWLRSEMPSWLRSSVLSAPGFDIQAYELLGYLIVPVLAYGLHRLTLWLLAACVQWLLVRRGWDLPRETVLKQLRPMGRFVAVLFLRWGLLVIGPDKALLVPLLTVLNPLVWLLGMWAIFRLIDLITELIEAHLTAQKRRPEISQMLWPVASLALKILVLVVTLFRLMAMFSWDMTAVLTGLGIGGLAFALGAQDSLKNLFGSFTLIIDRPFVVGEKVKIGAHEGVVEVVGLRSTRIRTAEDTLLIVPNSNLTTTEVTNYGRRRYRRYQTRIGVAYATPLDRLSAFRDALREVIQKQAHTRKDQFDVAINDLAASAIEVLVSVYFEVADGKQELAAREALILDILRLAEDLNIELAYPTQTIHVVAPAAPASRSAEQAELTTSGHPPH
jgi:MscS family membrane protein